MLELLPYPLYFLIIPIGLRLTCYYFHGWFEEKILRPFAKLAFNSDSILPSFLNFSMLRGFSIDMVHRYFLLLSIPLVLVHLSISLYHTLASPVMWVQLDSLRNLAQVAYSIIQPRSWQPHFNAFNLTEWTDSILLALYVGSCHVIRYFLGSGDRCADCKNCRKQSVLSSQTKFNIYHGSFFWLSIISLLAHTIFVEMVNLGVVAI